MTVVADDGAVDDAPEPTPGIEPLAPAARTYAMLLLLGIYMVNFLDRQVVNILAEPIRNDLGLNDTQIGMMSGLAFAVFYTFLGLPIARLAERFNRPFIIGAAVAAWSGFTVMCGQAQNFAQLAIARIGVGVGEAGCTPPAHSLIADYVPKEKRASALAFYSMGTPLGGLLGLVLGGLIADAYGWRTAFMVAGAPGLIFAVLAVFTLNEPRRQLADRVAHMKANSVSMAETIRVLLAKRTFWLIALAAAVKAFIGYGHAPFTASFFLRNHTEEVAALARHFGIVLGFDLQSVGFLGLALGVMGGTAGAVGSILGGWIADRFGSKDLRAYMVAPAIASLVTIPIFIVAVSVDSAALALCILVINGLLGTLWYGPVYSTGQGIVPLNMRATASAVLLFIINLIGLGLGPLLVGMLSDYFANGMGMGAAQGVRWALMTSTLFGIAAFAMFWMARKTIREEMVS